MVYFLIKTQFVYNYKNVLNYICRTKYYYPHNIIQSYLKFRITINSTNTYRHESFSFVFMNLTSNRFMIKTKNYIQIIFIIFSNNPKCVSK